MVVGPPAPPCPSLPPCEHWSWVHCIACTLLDSGCVTQTNNPAGMVEQDGALCPKPPSASPTLDSNSQMPDPTFYTPDSKSQNPDPRFYIPVFFCGTLRPIVGPKMLVAARIPSLNTPNSNKNGFSSPKIHYPYAQNNTPKTPRCPPGTPHKMPQMPRKTPQTD